MGGLTEKQLMMLNGEEPSLDDLEIGETRATQKLKIEAETKELQKKKSQPWWKEMMRSELVQEFDPIFHKSYMLMSSYVTDVAIKVELYLNFDRIVKVDHKQT